MKPSWIPVSSAALVSGAFALLLGALLMPTTGDEPGTALQIAREHEGRWFGVAVLFLLAAMGLLLGIPAIMTLVRGRAPNLGYAGVAVLAIACAGTTGYAMLLVFFRALVLADAIRPEQFDDVVRELGLNSFLYGWVASFYLAELLIGLAVLRARTTPRWVPLLLLGHVALLPVSRLLPTDLRQMTVLLVVLGYSGMAIAANTVSDDAELATRSSRR